MKFAMIIDSISNCESFYVKDSKPYKFKDHTPYSLNFSIGIDCYVNMWNYPWLYENGHFINWAEFKHDLPDLDLDLIFLTIERCLDRNDHHPWIDINNIRKKYPKAKIVGYMKEVWVTNPYDYTDPKHLLRLEFLNNCDAVVHNRPEINGQLGTSIKDIRDKIDVPVNFVGQPQNTEYYYKHFAKDKDLAIWAYLPNPMQRRGDTYQFAEYISKKYDIPVKYKQMPTDGSFNVPLEEFVNQWSSCGFHFNLDPIDFYPGNQCTQVASTGCINIGGVNDNHHILFPDTATCDKTILENKFVLYLNNDQARHDVIKYAWKQLNNFFSFDAVRNQIKNIEYK